VALDGPVDGEDRSRLDGIGPVGHDAELPVVVNVKRVGF
jgi:hypothetical protein